MKAILTTIALMLTATFATAANDDWTTNLEAAFEQAKKENKHVLVEFTGSDWCPPCKVMRKNVFSQKSFTSQASKDFVLVELDFPRNNKSLATRNEPYANRYGISAFPTVILFDSKGKEYNRFTATAHPSVDRFLGHLNRVKG